MSAERPLSKAGKETILITAFAYVLLDLVAHWHPGLRSSWEFLPREQGGDVNEFVTLWLAEFSRNVRELGFAKTLYLVNPWSAGGFYGSHPGLLTFFAAVWQGLFGESPDTLRRLAILFFSLRLGFLHALVARTYGIAVARVALLFYLLTPTTQTYTHALSFEVISGTFVLAAFWARRWWVSAAFFALAGLTDWTALLALPVFLWFAPRRLLSSVLVLVPVLAQYFWAKSFEVAGSGGESQLFRLYMYLVGPYHVLRDNPEAVATLWRALLTSFPVPLLVFSFVDLFRHGIKKREPWFYGCLFAGCAFLVMFLGVFRVHPYVSQLLILPLCAAGARGYWDFFEKPYCRWSGLALLVAMGVWWNAYPFQTKEMAERRLAYRLEAEKIAEKIRGKYYFVLGDRRYLRPEPLSLYFTGAKPMLLYNPGKKLNRTGCADYTVIPRPSSAPTNSSAFFNGNFLDVEEHQCEP